MKQTKLAAFTALMLVATPLVAQAETFNMTDGTGTTTNWTTEDHYWSDNYASRPYYTKTTKYTSYSPAYRYGYDTYTRYPGRDYSTLDRSELENGWNKARGDSKLTWEQAELATRDEYVRMYNNNDRSGVPGNTTVPDTSTIGLH